MSNNIRIKRRLPNSPLGNSLPSLSSGELAFNEINRTLYYGASSYSVGISAIPIGGDGAFTTYTYIQSITSTFANSTELNALSAEVKNLSTDVKIISAEVKSLSSEADNKFLLKSGGKITGNLTIYGDLSATGTSYFANTIYTTTSALSIININNTGPALYVANNGTGDLASFYDLDTNTEVFHIGGANGSFPNVGVKTSSPNKDFTVNGEISASGSIWTSGNFISAGKELLSIIYPDINLGISSYTTVKANSSNWDSVYTSVSSLSTNWSSVYTSTKDTSGNWNSVYNTVNPLSSSWNSVYTSTNNTSGSWNSVYNTVNPLSSNWNSVYSNVQSNSANAVSVYSSVNSLSGNWNSVYTSTRDVSGNWNSVYTSTRDVSGNWNSVYNTVNPLSSNWNSVYTSTSNTSGSWNSVYNTVNPLSSNWNSVYTSTNNTSGNWNSVYTNVNTNSANFQSTYLTLSSLSGNWNSVYTSTNNTSGSWNSVYNTVNPLSGNWNSVYNTVNPLSGSWNSVYSNVQSNSANAISVYSSVNSVSGNWNSAYTSTRDTSGNWNSVYNTVNPLSSNWNTSYTNLVTNSAAYLSGYDLSFLSVSGNWNSVYTSTRDNSGSWNSVYNTVNPLSGNWNSVYSSVNAASANWNSVYTSVSSNSATYATYNYVNSNFLNLTGGIVNGSVSVLSSFEVGVGSAVLFASGGRIGINTELPNVELTVNGSISASGNIWTSGNFISAGKELMSIIYPDINLGVSSYTTVKSNSANWNASYTNLVTNSAAYLSGYDLSFLSVSGNWNSVYSSVNATSANWNSVYTSTRDNSGSWNSVYNTVNPLSSSWNSVYNTVNPLSSNWNSVYTSTNNTSGNWNSVYNTVNPLSSNWNSVYTNVNVNSGSYATINYTDSKFFPISGGNITGATKIQGNLTVYGDLSATGNSYFFNTVYSTTSALSVVNIGNTGPALYVGNNGTGDIASFYDIDSNIEVFHIGGANGTFPNVGVKTSTPNKDFTVNGEISANNTIYDISGNSNQWNSVYNTVISNSAINWNYQGTDLKDLSANWVGGNIAFTNLISNSAAYLSGSDLSFLSVSGNWNSVYGSVNSLSGNWNSVYSSTSNTSGSWNSVYNTVNPLSGNWDSTYTSVLNTSSNWDSTYTTLQNNSADWIGGNLAYTNLVSNSASYLSGADLSLYLPISGGTMTGPIYFTYPYGSRIDQGIYDSSRGGLSGISLVCSVNYDFNWQAGWITSLEQDRLTPRPLYIDSGAGTPIRVWDSSTGTGIEVSHTEITFPDNTSQTTAFTGTAIDTGVRELTSYWDSVYTNVNSYSATYATYNYVDSNFLNLTGGIIDGNLSVLSSFEVGGNNAILFVSGGKVGINTKLPSVELTVSGSISASNKIYGTIIDWMTLTRGYKTVPTFNSTIVGGDVYTYVYESSPSDKTYYRYIATDGSEDAYYGTFSGGILSNVIAKKEIII